LAQADFAVGKFPPRFYHVVSSTSLTLNLQQRTRLGVDWGFPELFRAPRAQAAFGRGVSAGTGAHLLLRFHLQRAKNDKAPCRLSLAPLP
jgi:hypothetical protein